MRTLILCILLSFLIEPTIAQSSFTDITEEAGIQHVYKVFEGTFGGGAVAFDYDNDGFDDLYITGGLNDDILYHNNGDGSFTNTMSGSGLELSKDYVTQGAFSADINRDGYRDLFITTINKSDGSQKIPRAKNLLFLNKGDGQFEEASDAFGIADLRSFSTGACFGDFNQDGYPDLFVGNYFKNFTGKLGIIKDATIVSANETAESYLLQNVNGEKFVEVSKKYNIDHRGFGFGGIFTDFDNDGDLDLMVNQDFGYKAVPNILYENQYPKKKFKDVSKKLGMDLKINAMGSAAGDFDNDGWLDYYVTNIKFNFLMVNNGPNDTLANRSKELGTYAFAISWGANFVDFDNDGDLDLYVANGDLNPNCIPMGNFYFENQNNSFSDKGHEAGIKDFGIGRGSVVFDMENDGDMDLLVVNQEAVKHYPTTSITKLYRNDSPPQNWLALKLIGQQSDMNGLGTRITVVNGNQRKTREIDGGGSSHLSQNSSIAHFGLGQEEKVDSIIIQWSKNNQQIVLDPTINKVLLVEEEPISKKSWTAYLLCILAALVLIFILLIYRQKLI